MRHDGASEEERVRPELRAPVLRPDDRPEQLDGLIQLALGTEGFRDAIVGLDHLRRPRIQGFELLEELARRGGLLVGLGDPPEPEKGNRLGLLNSRKRCRSGRVGEIHGELLEDLGRLVELLVVH